MNVMKRIAVYCGSSSHARPSYFEAARAFGYELATQNIELVYGGGKVGLMGAVADAVLERGGRVTGVIPHRIRDLEVAHQGLSELIVVDSMHARKTVMASLSDAFVALPGGFGTLDELFEVTTWNQLGYHYKPAGFLNVEGYFDHLLAFITHAGAEGFIREAHRGLLCVADTPATMLDSLRAMNLPRLEQWMDKP